MRPHARRLAAPFAVAYLAAGWLAAALHSHAPHEPSEAACTACSCGHHHHGPKHPAADEQGSKDDRRDSEHEHGHNCVVCQHLAKPPLTVAAVSIVAVPEPVARAAKPAAPVPTSVFVPAWWSRGPPAA